MGGDGPLDGVLALRVDAEGPEDGPDRCRADLDVLAEPVPVLGGDAVGVGEIDEPGRGEADGMRPILPCRGSGPQTSSRQECSGA